MHSMIRLLLALALAGSLSFGLAPIGASSAPAGGGFVSDNVEWLGVIPTHTGTAGGKLVGDFYYVADPRGVYIYDVSTPEAPKLTGSLAAAQSTTHAVLAQEEPDTNGEIMLVNAIDRHGLEEVPHTHQAPPSGGWLLVIDVSNKTAPRVVGRSRVYDHTWACILDCSYAIGRTGPIIDLTDPTNPRQVANWREHVKNPGYMHHFVEVAPGRVIGAGQPSLYLDLRNPVRPVELARINPGFHSLGYHGASWPNGATDPLLLMGAEVAPPGPTNLAGSDCTDPRVHAVATYDATDVIKVDEKQFGPTGTRGTSAGHAKQREMATFQKLEEWRVSGRGVYADGRAPAHTLYCGHWFDPHPDWDAGGLLALSHYDWGTRFLDVAADGSMEEVGWFTPVQGYSGAAKWITDEIVYVHDYRRGLEILRFSE